MKLDPNKTEEFIRWTAASDPCVIGDEGLHVCYYCKNGMTLRDVTTNDPDAHLDGCWYTWCCEHVGKQIANPSIIRNDGIQNIGLAVDLEDLAKEAAEGVDPDEAFDAMVKRMGNYGRSELADIRELDPLRMDELVCIKCGCRAAECVCKQVTGAEPV